MRQEENLTILFQGDSITDCGRTYDDVNNLGFGYPSLIDSILNFTHPYTKFKIINRGISGNRVVDLQARWVEDCLNLKPDILSILIGVNDTWRRYDSNLITTANDYYDTYKNILTQAHEKLPNTKIVLLEPFLLPVNDRIEGFYDDLDDKIKKVRKLAAEFNAIYIPLDGLFAKATANRSPEFWSADGVHPTNNGHMLIAQTWIESVIDRKI